jgi:hypothetical protein
MTGIYLSTNLIAQRNQTLADIEVSNYSLMMIEDMELDLIDMVQNIWADPVLIDPKAELKR